ncbi:MAG: hypothetical protein HKN20_14580 [Gemmatimonadetes bacterium]|nr:hypothetical protein [Gemmatimonadota bacterium]
MNLQPRSIALCAVLTALVASGPAHAATIVVKAGESIQAALNAAQQGDVVAVDPGYFNVNLTMPAGVTLRGAGADLTTLDGGGVYSVIRVPARTERDTRIEGFRIVNGSADRGGGISVGLESFPSIADCEFIGNNGGRGGAIYIGEAGGATVERCRFMENTANEGAGIYVFRGPASIRFNIFCGNDAFITGGGMHFSNTIGAVAVNNTIVRNTSAHGFGSGVSFGGSQVDFSRNIVAYNDGGHGISVVGSDIVDECNVLFQNHEGDMCGKVPSESDLIGDPRFCDMDACELSIEGNSLATKIDCGGFAGALPVGCAFTASETVSWGEVKALFR